MNVGPSGDHPETIGQRLTEARTNAGLSRGQVARLLFMPLPLVSAYEVTSQVSDMELLNFAGIYDVTFEFLRFGTLRDVALPDDTGAVTEDDKAKLKRQLGMMREKRG